MDILKFDVKSTGTSFVRVICDSKEQVKEAKAKFRAEGYKFQSDPYLNCLRGFYEGDLVKDFFNPETRPEFGLIFRKEKAFKVPKKPRSKKPAEPLLIDREELLKMLKNAK